MDDDNVRPLPVKFKAPASDEEPMLKIVQTSWTKDECDHKTRYANERIEHASYLIREGETEVECSLCNRRLDPMFVLMRLARKESEWHRTRALYQDEMKRLSARKRTKCESCGHMTRISSG